MKENRDSNVINRVTFSIGQDKDSSRAGRMGGNGTATSRSMLIGSTNCLTETSGRVARLQTTSFSFREVKDRLLTKNNLNFKRASSARTDYLSDQTASHNPDNCSTPVAVKVNDVLLLKQGNGKSEEAKTWAATVEAKTSNEAACRSHSFSLKRITNKLFSKCATSHEHKATLPSSERQLLDHDDQHMEEVDNVDKPPVMSLPHEYALIDSADEILPQMRPKSRSWSHADVAVKIRRSASTRSATIAVRSDLSVNSTAIASHRNADKLAQKKPFLKRFLLLTRECAAEDGASESTLLQGSPSHGDGFEEALTGMRPKSKSFSNTSEISRPKRNFTRQCSSEASVNVIPQCNKEDLVDTAARSQCPIAALRIPRSASCIFPCCTPKLKRRRKTLSACCSPLYLPTQIRFSLPDAAATEPLSREFATLLNELRHKRHSPRLGITRNVVKTFFRRVFVRKTARCLVTSFERNFTGKRVHTPYDVNYLDGKWEDSLRPRKREKWLPEQKANKIGRSLKNLVIRPVEKRFHRFQQLFGKIVGEADELIAAYSCAFQSRILSQGHLYVSQRNISFYSNSLSWETQFIIPFSKVTKISKQKTAKVLPNAVLIETCDEERYLFTCFTQRDKSFTLLLYVWQSSIDGASIVPADLWKLRCTPDGRLDSSSSKLGSASPWGTSPRSLQRMPETIVSPKNSVSSITDSAVGCSDSNLMRNSSACLLDSKHSGALNESSDEESNISEGDLSNESKVSCPCRSHLGRVLLDDVFRLTAQQLFTILFSEIPWYQQFADIVKQTAQSRLFDSISGYAASPWITGHSGVTSSTRTATYTMALNHAMAPKSTVITEKQVCMELEQLSDGFVVTTESQNAGIPYADSFLIQCKYCVTRVDSTHSRLLIHGGIIYKKSIWGIVRGYIEKSTYAGLEDHYAALDETLKVHCERNADAPSCSLDDNLCMQRFNTTHFASLTFQPSSSIPFLKRRGSGHETDASTFNTRVNTNVTSTSSRGLPMRSRAITEDTQTQTLPVVQTPHLTYYVRLIITLLTTLILLHVCTLLKLWSTETPQRCHTNHHVAHMLAGNADSLAVADLMRFDPTEKTQSQVAEFRRTIDQVPQTKLTEIREIWRRTDEP